MIRKQLFKISFGNFGINDYRFDISKIDVHSNMCLTKVNCLHPVDQFRPGVRYNFFLYGCRNQGYQLLRSIIGYIEELGKLNG